MKKLLILSAVMLFPFILLSLSLAIIVILKPEFMGSHEVSSRVLWLSLILCVCASVITMTTLNMIRYTSRIDKLDKAEEDVRLEQKRLLTLIKQYNDLISSHNRNFPTT